MDQTPRPHNKLALIIFCVCAVFVAGWFIFRPYPRPPFHLVEPRLRTLQEPFTSVETSYFTDGGSIGISITDANGHKEEFALPNRMGRNENYSTVFVGAIHVNRPGVVPVTNSSATKQELIRVLGNYRNETDIQATLAIISGRLRDKIKATANRLSGKVRP